MGYVLLALALGLASMAIIVAADTFGVGAYATTALVVLLFAGAGYALKRNS
jgi:hypothetical protein